jgi:hypothetical protein
MFLKYSGLSDSIQLKGVKPWMAHVKQDVNTLSINMFISKALKNVAYLILLCALNYDKFACETWVVHDKGKQKLLDVEVNWVL